MLFSHGRESGPGSRKIGILRPLAAERGWQTETPDYRGMTPAERIDLLLERVGQRQEPVALVGSSMGGIVSVLAAQKIPVAGLFLMAPAVYYPGYEELDHAVRTPVMHILHGWADTVVSPESVIRFAREHHATLHLVDDGHNLLGRIHDLERLFVDFLDQLEQPDEHA